MRSDKLLMLLKGMGIGTNNVVLNSNGVQGIDDYFVYCVGSEVRLSKFLDCTKALVNLVGTGGI